MIYLIALLGGILAGIINTLAGNGSTITLYILMDVFGLPPNIANASNRLGVVSQSLGSLPQFYRAGKLNLGRSWELIGWMFIGAILGIFLALWVDDSQFKAVFKYMMFVMLGVILVRPERWLRNSDLNFQLPFWLRAPIGLLLGFYGGFIQMGMGIFLLMFLVLGAKYSLQESNMVKIVSTAAYTLVAVLIFAYYGWIDWWAGGTLALGQTIGGYLGAFFATRYQNANIWVYRLLIVCVIWALVRMFV